VYAEPGWARIAGLAPSVVACAQQGDAVAQQILQEEAADLVVTVQAAVRQLHMPPTFQLVLAGAYSLLLSLKLCASFIRLACFFRQTVTICALRLTLLVSTKLSSNDNPHDIV